MSSEKTLHQDEKTELGDFAGKVRLYAGVAGLVFLLAAVGWGMGNFGRFMHSYLIGFTFALSICVGALFFVLIHHLTGAGWSVVVRRIAEHLTAAFPLLFVLMLVIIVPMLLGNTDLYLWTKEGWWNADAHAGDHLLHHKAGYLSVGFFSIRLVFYFVAWTAMSWYFRKLSIAQDESGDPKISDRLRKVSAPALILFSIVTAFGAFDILMSLEPHWFSTMYPVYFFAGCAVSVYATISLIALALQKKGFLKHSITVEHYHDLGKFVFGFIFFWGYVAFSQFMLIWYANIPEETGFFARRMFSDWGAVSLVLLFVHFIIPFVLLMSRWTKRKLGTYAFFCVWILVAHWIDLYWNIAPAFNPSSTKLVAHPTDILATIGIFGLFIAAAAHSARKASLIPLKDPKLGESLAFENI